MGEMISEGTGAPLFLHVAAGPIQQAEREKEDEREGRKGGKERF